MHRLGSLQFLLLGCSLACASASPPGEETTRLALAHTTGAARAAPAPAAPVAAPVREQCAPQEHPDDGARLDETYSSGLAAVREQRYDAALPLLREVYVARCSEHALFLIGVVLDRLGDLDGARRAFELYREIAASEPGQRRAVLYLACLQRRERDPDVDCLKEQTSAPPP